MLDRVLVSCCFVAYMQHLSAIIKCHHWTTPPVPICFQADTMSPIIFLPLFNNALKLAENHNKGYGFRFHLTIPHSAKLPPVGAYVNIKWLEPGDKPPGCNYKAQVSEYSFDGSCKVIYNESSSNASSETLTFNHVEWLPCYKRSLMFVAVVSRPKLLRLCWKEEPKSVQSSEHSTKASANDATLISISKEAHTKVLNEVNFKAGEIDFTLKLSKFVSLLFNGTKFLPLGILVV